MISKIKFLPLKTLCLALLLIGSDTKRTHTFEKKTVKSIVPENIKTNTKIIDPLKYKDHVWGKDEEGNNVHGRIIVEGKNGIGIIINNKGQEIEIVFEILNRKKIIATDIEGFQYKLKID
jgi:hypothetical protein